MRISIIVIFLFFTGILFSAEINKVEIKDTWGGEVKVVYSDDYKKLQLLDNEYQITAYIFSDVDFRFVFESYESYFTYTTKKLKFNNEGKIRVVRKIYCGTIYYGKNLSVVIDKCLQGE